METNTHILTADKYVSLEYSEHQIRENQDQAYYITTGIEEIKDIHNILHKSLSAMKNNMEEISKEIKYLKDHDEPIKEFDMMVERYSRYNSNMSLESILKHPRVMQKKPIMDKYKQQIRHLQIALKVAQDEYNKNLQEKTIEYNKLRDKFIIYSTILGTNETLEQID